MNDAIRRRLVGLGAFSVLIYLVIAVVSFKFRYGEGHRDRPILLVLGLLGMAWCLYALALFAILSRRSKTQDHAACRDGIKSPRMRTVLFFGVVFRVIMLGSNPIQEIDYYRYLWDGHVLLAGMNPFEYAPAEIDESGPGSAAKSRPGRLWALTHRSESVRTIFERVHHREVPTIYPPVAQAVFAASVFLTPEDSPVWVYILVLRIILVGFDLGTLLVLARLLVRVRLPAELCLAYGWCPLVLKEFANSGHLDAIAVFFTTLGLYWLTGVLDRRSAPTAGPRQLGPGPKSAMAALGVSILAKSYPVVILPVVAAYLIGRLRIRAVVPILVLVAVVAAGYAPFVGATRGPQPAPAHTPFTGLGTFLARWQKNDFLFMLVHENLRPPIAGVPDRAVVFVSPETREALSRWFLARWGGNLQAAGVDPSFLTTQIVMGALVAGLSLFWAWRVLCQPDPELLLRGVGHVLAWGWLLSSTPHPWYLIWSLPFLVFVPQRSWFLMTGLVFLYYLRFWFEYQASTLGLEAVENSLDRFDHEFICFEYVPFFTVLIVDATWGRWRRLHRPGRIVTRPPKK